MNILKYTLLILLATQVAPCHAMDKPEIDKSSEQKSHLDQLPYDVLNLILKLVIENDPDSIGNLTRIQEVCKSLAGFLSKDQIKQILNLDQATINREFQNSVASLDSEYVHILLNLGAQFDKHKIIPELLRTLTRTCSLCTEVSPDLRQKKYVNILKIIAVLEKSGATWKHINDSEKGITLLYLAIQEHAPFVVKLLLEHGAHINRRTEDLRISSDLEFAIMRAETQSEKKVEQPLAIVKLLLEHKVQLNPEDISDAFMISAIDKQNYPVVELLIKHGFEPQVRFLDRAILSGNLKLVTFFLKYISVNPSFLAIAAQLETTEGAQIAQLLIENGADVNSSSQHYLPPLAYAKTPEMAAVLLNGGAQLFIDCEKNSTPFKQLVKTARQQKNPMILVEVLKQRYKYETAMAIAIALRGGISFVKTVCTIL